MTTLKKCKGTGKAKNTIDLKINSYICMINLRSHNSGIKNIACLFDLRSETLNDNEQALFF